MLQKIKKMAHLRKPPHSVMRLYYEPSKMSIGGLKKCL